MRKYLCFTFILIFFSCKNDPSHSIEEAMKLGAPAIDKKWNVEDFDAFKNYILNISANSYPKTSSPKSKDLFHKFINDLNTIDFSNKSISINERFPYSISVLISLNELFVKYMNAHDNLGYNYSEELTYLQSIGIVQIRKMMFLVDELLPTIDKNDEDYEVRIEGVRKMKESFKKALDGLYVSLTELEIYPDKERLIIMKYLNQEGSLIINKFPPEIREIHKAKIKKLIKNEKILEIKNRLEKLLNKID